MSAILVALMLASAAGGAQARPMIGEDVARVQWDMAENRAQCAPLALLSDGGAKGKARAADFSGGWAVAFDLPGIRSAYGFAGPGIIPMDAEPDAAQRARLDRQWPYRRTLAALPGPAFAGYGLIGAEPYPAANPEGKGSQSLAYLRIDGQRCTYNVWSRIGRAHLETLLDNLRLQD
ncbi:hypothetical protein K9B33_03055 [Sphingobium sp. 3R8]|uniref:hypothetical protein n=1 Tax=Sphingobium sp. 3R8 TaxID=2874921 RepID=UPI001CCF754C|nr:hypothetical protein [Sphingobium sp. 3R8]MBZ9646514.1 hypothetical protein [Sphingobium sp. 3R8]